MADLGNTIYNDFYARRYDLLFHDTPAGRERFGFETAEIRHRIRRLADPGPARLLDLGCGTGRHCALLSGECHTTGVDSSESMLQVARAASPRTAFIQGDMRDPDLFSAGAFTYVLCLYGAIHYSRELDRILENIARWLCPGGEACLGIIDPTGLSPESAEMSSESRWIGQQMVTPFPAFEYRSRWEQGGEDRAYYHETFVLPWLEVIERRHEFYLPRIEVLAGIAAATGLCEVERVSMEPVDCGEELLVFFRNTNGRQSK